MLMPKRHPAPPTYSFASDLVAFLVLAALVAFLMLAPTLFL